MIHALLFMTLVTSGISPGPGDDYFIKAGKVYLGTGEAIDGAVIHVRDGRVVAVGGQGAVQIPGGAHVHDLSACTLMPGLVEGVSYAGVPGGRAGNEEGRENTPSLHVSRVVDPLATETWRRVRVGVTSFVVHPGSRNVIGGIVCHAKPMSSGQGRLVRRDELALRITLGSDPAAGHGRRGGRGGTFMSRRPLSRMATVYEVREQLQRALNYRERRSAGAPVAEDPDYEMILRALDGDIPVHWQARAEKDIHAALRLAEEFGIKRNVLIEAIEADKVAMDLAARKAPVLVGPLFHPQYGSGPRAPMNPAIDAPEEEHDHDHDAHACCVAAPPGEAPDTVSVHRPVSSMWKLWDAGVPCAFARGGDVPGKTLLDFARLSVRNGLPADRAIPMLTLEPARICGIDDRVGSIAPGKDADFVVLDGDPLAPTSDIVMVVVDGEVVVDTRKETSK